jgi:hypothetical protein
MESATKTYLERDAIPSPGNPAEYQAPKIVLQQVAERLVRHRRLREATKADDLRRWQTHMGQWLTGELRPEDGMRVPVQPEPLGMKWHGLGIRDVATHIMLKFVHRYDC